MTHAIIETDQETVEVNTRLQKLALSQSNESGEHTNDSHIEIVEELEEEIGGLRSSRKVFEELLSETHYMRTGQRLHNIDISDGGQLLVGLINPK